MRPFFSLIIPCINSKSDHIKKLFGSLSRQEVNKDDLEVIVVDDNSEDKSYQDIIKSYDLNVIFVENNTNVHCPGNTRKKGLEYVSGEWLCFCDHDDYFEDNIFSYVKAYIESADHDIYAISTITNEYNELRHEYVREFDHKNAWLHGKWYSMDRLIKPYRIDFKTDLITNEDVFFNCTVLDKLIVMNKNYDYLNTFSYRWVENPNSTSRVGFASSERGYLYDGFADYLYATTEPYWADALETRNAELIRQIRLAILHGYFYYESASYYDGGFNYTDVLNMVQDLIARFINEFGYNAIQLIDDVYSDPDGWKLVREGCELYQGTIIPKTSFRDFVLKLLLDL